MGRTIAGLATGLFSAGVVIFMIETVGHSRSPGTAYAAAILALGIGVMLGAFVAARIAGQRVSIIVPLFLAALTVYNLLSFAHPWWFFPAALIVLAGGWSLGATLGARR